MRNWRKWMAEKEARSERARHAAEARWAAVHAARAGEPERKTIVAEITIRHTVLPRRVIRLEAEPTEHGISRWRVTENGARIGRRRFGRTAVAALIARSLA